MTKLQDNLKYLISLNIPYQYIDFDVLNGEERQNIKNKQICKTLVAKGKASGILIISIPINKQADWNKIKAFLNDKKVRLVDNVESVSGYPHGANGALMIFKDHPEYTYLIDETLVKHEKLVTNAGQYAKSVILNTSDYLQLVPHQIGDFVKDM